MADDSQGQGRDKQNGSSSPGVNGTRVPKSSLEDATKLAHLLWDAAKRSSIPLEAFGSKLGIKTSSGGFRTKIGLLRYFGLIITTDKNIGLSTIGFNIVQEQDLVARESARKQAFMTQEHYAALLSEHGGEELPAPESLAKVFEYRFQMKTDSAKQAAEAYTSSLTFAGFIDPEGKVIGHGAESESHTELNASKRAASNNVTPDKSAVPPPPSDEGSAKLPPATVLSAHSTNPVSVVNITINIDLNAATPEQLTAVMAALKG